MYQVTGSLKKRKHMLPFFKINKILLLFILTIPLFLTSCKPERRIDDKTSNEEMGIESDKTMEDSTDNENVKDAANSEIKEYKMELKAFNINEVQKALNLDEPVSKEEEFELGENFYFNTGAIVNFQNGSMTYYEDNTSDYINYISYLEIDNLWRDNGKEDDRKLAEDFLDQVNLNNLKLKSSDTASAHDIKEVINEGEDLIYEKEGESPRNLSESLVEASCFLFVSQIDGIYLIEDQLQLANARNLLPATCQIIVSQGQIIYVNMAFIPDVIDSEKPTSIVSKDQAEKLFYEDWNKAAFDDEIEIKSIDLKYSTVPVEMLSVLIKPTFNYIPVYEISTDIHSFREGEEVVDKEIFIMDARDGVIIR